MAQTDALAQLKDIHLPAPPGFWPLASGWYLVFTCFLLLVSGCFLFIYRKRIHAKPKNQALLLLKKCREEYEKERNSQAASAQVSELLRRVALAYYSRDAVAGLHGEAWIEFLNQTGKGIDFIPINALLLDLPFKPSQFIDLELLFQTATLWIKQRGIPCCN